MTDSATHLSESTAAVAPDTVFADILCAVDGTRGSFAAVEQAASLAGPSGHLTLLAVTAVAGGGAFRQAALGDSRAELILDRAADMAYNAGVGATKVVDPAEPAVQVILERATQHDLLAIGAPVTSWLGGMFIGGVAAQTLGEFTTPLLAARALPTEHRFAERILVASDGLQDPEQVVELAGRLASTRSAELILLHAIGVESNARPHRIEAQLHRLEETVGGPVQARIAAADARELILASTAGNGGPPLLVMGSRRLEGLRAIGSVSRRVVHEARCSVLLVPPADAG
ncbi:MAG TPA: universal stress protein [Solirubrobacteraceae bacterium]|nr:universal stress protein [Solirubrobacteraceae bacterium]